MIYNTNHYTIADLLSGPRKARFVIPKYQREYIWSKDNWDTLFDDLLEGKEQGAFIGSMLCVQNDSADAAGIQELEVVDGQQRLATVSLLYCALYEAIKKGDSQTTGDALRQIKDRLVYETGEPRLHVVLSEQHMNVQDYRILLNELGIATFHEDNKGWKGRRIHRAYRYFAERIKEYGHEDLLKLLAWLDGMLVVKIEVSSHADAFMLFEGLNDRGVPLSAADLIKNKLFSELERRGVDIGESFSQWNDFLENSINHTVQERLLRQFYNAFHIKEQFKIKDIAKATKANLVEIYEALIMRDPKAIFDELLAKSAIYHNLIKGNAVNMPFAACSDELKQLAEVKAAPAYMLLLYLLDAGMTDANFFKEVIGSLTRYFQKRELSDYQEIKDVDQFLMDLIKEIEEDKRNRLTAEYVGGYLTHTIYLK